MARHVLSTLQEARREPRREAAAAQQSTEHAPSVDRAAASAACQLPGLEEDELLTGASSELPLTGNDACFSAYGAALDVLRWVLVGAAPRGFDRRSTPGRKAAVGGCLG